MKKRITNDLTEGPVPKKLLRFAFPIILATFLQSVYGIVDMVIVGQYLGSSALSGVSVGGNLMNFFSFVALGLSTGGNVVIGQFFGSGDEEKRKESTATTFAFMLLVGLSLFILVFILTVPLIQLMQAPSEAEAQAYLRICAVGCIFIFGYNALCSIIRAVGDSRTPLLIIAVAAVVNVGLDFLLIGPFHMKVAGAAVATVSSQCISFLIALLHVLRTSDFFGFSIRNIRIYKDKLKLILKIGIPSALVFCINGITHMFNLSLINTHGIAASAGCGSAIKVSDLSIGFITSMMNASATMCAQCIGAKKYARVRQVFQSCLLTELCIAVCLSAVMFFGADLLIGLFNTETQVILLGSSYLKILAFQVFTYIFFTSLHSVATGAGDAKLVMWNSIAGMAFPRVILSLVFHQLIGLTGMALSCVVAPLCAIPAALIYYKKGKWQHSLGGRNETDTERKLS